MTTIQTMNGAPIDQAHEERLQRCAELGEVTRIDKPRIRAYYEQLARQVQAEKSE